MVCKTEYVCGTEKVTDGTVKLQEEEQVNTLKHLGTTIQHNEHKRGKGKKG